MNKTAVLIVSGALIIAGAVILCFGSSSCGASIDKNMKKKVPAYKKGGSVRSTSKTAAKPAGKKAAPPFGRRPKGKIPALGSGMMGLGGTGAQGMLP